MTRQILIAIAATATLLTGLPTVAQAAQPGPAPVVQVAPAAAVTHPCGVPAPGRIVCDAVVQPLAAGLTISPGDPTLTDLHPPYSASEIEQMYGTTDWATHAGDAPLVAIVDAYRSADTAGALTAYRHTMGLPDLTTGQFTEVNETGGSRLPSADPGWGSEAILDVEAVSAVCPQCRILLVDAATPSDADLNAAIDTAMAGGARFVSMSWGGNDDGRSLTALADHPKVSFFAASGDAGYATSYPAADPHVLSVGGVSSTWVDGAWVDSAWSGAGSGCSPWQPSVPAEAVPDAIAACGEDAKPTADISALADPTTGFLVTDGSMWMATGGTSLATPIATALAAMADANDAFAPYAHRDAITDVTLGASTGCSGRRACEAKPGWDGPTGLGVPTSPAAWGGTGWTAAPHASTASLDAQRSAFAAYNSTTFLWAGSTEQECVSLATLTRTLVPTPLTYSLVSTSGVVTVDPDQIADGRVCLTPAASSRVEGLVTWQVTAPDLDVTRTAGLEVTYQAPETSPGPPIPPAKALTLKVRTRGQYDVVTLTRSIAARAFGAEVYLRRNGHLVRWVDSYAQRLRWRIRAPHRARVYRAVVLSDTAPTGRQRLTATARVPR